MRSSRTISPYIADFCTSLRGTALARALSEMSIQCSSTQSWTRLEAYLASLRPGDVITVNDTIEKTDLAPETVHIILAALTKANLFERSGDRFTRRTALRSEKLEVRNEKLEVRSERG
jgi:DNA-binding MarR family transcriptional regulator